MPQIRAMIIKIDTESFFLSFFLKDYYDARKLHKQGNDTVNEIVHQESKNSILAQIHKIIGPFILRRKKSEVDLSILPKKEVLVYCPMTLAQRQQYQTFVSVLKGGIVSEVVFNLVPFFKKIDQITVPQIFTLF